VREEIKLFKISKKIGQGEKADVLSASFGVETDSGTSENSVGSSKQYICESCGIELNRDLNASRNISRRAELPV